MLGLCIAIEIVQPSGQLSNHGRAVNSYDAYGLPSHCSLIYIIKYFEEALSIAHKVTT